MLLMTPVRFLQSGYHEEEDDRLTVQSVLTVINKYKYQ